MLDRLNSLGLVPFIAIFNLGNKKVRVDGITSPSFRQKLRYNGRRMCRRILMQKMPGPALLKPRPKAIYLLITSLYNLPFIACLFRHIVITNSTFSLKVQSTLSPSAYSFCGLNQVALCPFFSWIEHETPTSVARYSPLWNISIINHFNIF
jgi:hypothetical protein